MTLHKGDPRMSDSASPKVSIIDEYMYFIIQGSKLRFYPGSPIASFKAT